MDLELDKENRGDNVPENDQEIIIHPHTKPKSRWRAYFEKHKAGVIVSIILIVSLIAYGVGFYFLRYGRTDSTASNSTPDSAATSTVNKAYNILDGLAVDPSVANRHPLAIMVENHVDARPQSGLDKASLIYEAFAEGGITRFMALYSSFDAEKVGPVRSVRTYYIDWAHGYDAFLAHVGGSADALAKITAERTSDINQFAYSTPFWRQYTAGLVLEHTMYTSTAALRLQADKLGYSTANNLSSYKFKDDPAGADATALPESQKVSIDYQSAAYNVFFQYDKPANSYKRYIAGQPQLDNVTKNQIAPKNLIIITVSRRLITNKDGKSVYEMTTIGSGKARVFIDGKTIIGTWKKTSASSREMFFDETGAEITFNRGQFWVCVVPPESKITVE